MANTQHTQQADIYTSFYDHMPVLEVKLFHPDAKTPKRQTCGSVGHDLYSAEAIVVPAHQLKMINTGVGVRLPYETYARVAPRSGLALKGIDTLAGVVDPDWTGEIKVVLMNHSDKDFQVNVGDRIAQLILERICLPVVREVKDIPETDRGARGFGSTGK